MMRGERKYTTYTNPRLLRIPAELDIHLHRLKIYLDHKGRYSRFLFMVLERGIEAIEADEFPKPWRQRPE